MNHDLRKRNINNKLFIHSVKIHKDFFKLIYHSNGLWIISKDESRGIKKLLENTCLKVTKTKKELVARVFAASKNGVQPVKTAVKIESDLKPLISQYLTYLRYLVGGLKKMKEWHFRQRYQTKMYLTFWCSIPVN